MDPITALRELKLLSEQAPLPLQGHKHASDCFQIVLAALTPKKEAPSGDQPQA